MSTKTVQVQVSAIYCDHVGEHRCPNSHEVAGTHHEVRRSAAHKGWDVRPWRGKGSRTAGDYCPDHKTGAKS